MVKAESIKDFVKAFSLKSLKYDELDEFYYGDTMEFRTGDKNSSNIRDIFESCQTPSNNNIFLLMGHRGCGKSTELIKMASDLIKLGYEVILIHCGEELDPYNQTFSDLLILMGDALIKIAAKIGCDLDEKLISDISSYWNTEVTRINDISQGKDISFESGASVSSPSWFSGIINFFIGVKADLRLNEVKRTEYRTKIANSTNEWLGMLRLIADMITEYLDYNQPILIFEDLDKIDELDKAFDIFSNHAAAMTGVSFPVIYTCPIALSYYPRFHSLIGQYEAKTLPMIKIENMDGSKFIDGIDAIKKIVMKRSDLSLFDENVLELLIEKTGGSLRDLFMCICGAARISVRKGYESVSMEDALYSLSEYRSSLTRRIDSKNYDFLAKIHNGDRQYIEETEMLLKMIQVNTVLEYNGTHWYNIHPLVKDFLIDIGKIKPNLENNENRT